ncbi:MAG: LOG family protein [Pirellulales bacterium]
MPDSESNARLPTDAAEHQEISLSSDTGKTYVAPDKYEARIKELIAQLNETAEKLQRDRPALGDLKIIVPRSARVALCVEGLRTVSFAAQGGHLRLRPYPRRHADVRGRRRDGREMAKLGWMVVTGAGNGIMEAGHIGAGRENSMGLNIMLPFEQSSNSVIAGDPKLVTMKYFFTRKLMFVKECDAMILLPGGFGTLDEGLEVLTLLQTGKRDMVPVIFLDAPGGTFWKPFIDFVKDKLLGDRMISPEDQSLFIHTDSIQRTVEEVRTFYRSYHSMRYVKNKLVLRLHKAPDAALLAEINERFQGILAGGEFTVGEALPEEADEPSLIALPRLIFQFNRRALGKLRQLIDLVNRAA